MLSMLGFQCTHNIFTCFVLHVNCPTVDLRLKQVHSNFTIQTFYSFPCGIVRQERSGVVLQQQLQCTLFSKYLIAIRNMMRKHSLIHHSIDSKCFDCCMCSINSSFISVYIFIVKFENAVIKIHINKTFFQIVCRFAYSAQTQLNMPEKIMSPYFVSLWF